MIQYRCGILVPWVNTTVEEDLRILPEYIQYNIGRVWPSKQPNGANDESYLESMKEHALQIAEQFGNLEFDDMFLACTSAACQNVMFTTAGKQLQTVYGCLLSELRMNGYKNIYFASPYSELMQEHFLSALERDGVHISKMISIKCSGEFRDLNCNDVYAQCSNAGLFSDIVPLVISCTAITTRPLIQELKKKNIHCISSNSALINEIYRRTNSKNMRVSK
jgi:maleate cis-trans isomerase